MRLTKEQIQQIYELRDQGRSYFQISMELDVSTASVQYWLQERELQRLRAQRAEEQKRRK